MSDVHILILGLASPLCLAILGFFGRRIARRVDEASEQRWAAVHERIGGLVNDRQQLLVGITGKLDELRADFREDREDIRQALAELARVQGDHERWARAQLVHLTSRIGRIEGRLRLSPPSEEDT